jgi:putative SOS response-associated peptidase YedK
MCARFSLTRPRIVAERFASFRLAQDYEPRYNIAPTQDVLAAKNDGAGEVVPLRWGLVPFWARDLSMGQRTINARVETLAEKPAFRHALAARRCLIFADGFYEWTGAKGDKQPYRFTVDGGAPFAFAGLWERWGPKDAPVETCTIVTCEPNALLARVHDRMPAILDEGAHDAWLHGDVADALAAVAPFDPARMGAAPVTRAVNRATFEDPSCVEPVDLPPVQTALI